jgi:hypothetical protein
MFDEPSLHLRADRGRPDRSYARVFFPAAGPRRRTMSPACPCTGPYWLALRVRAGASCVCRLRCPSASPPGHVSQGASRIVGLGDWLLDLSVEPCQTLPVCVGPFGNGFHDAVRSSPSGPHCFQGLLSFRPQKACTQKLPRSRGTSRELFPYGAISCTTLAAGLWRR